MPTNNEYRSIQALVSPIIKILSLPHEILQSVFGSITSFEPWTYNLIQDAVDTSISDEDLCIYTRDSKSLKFTSIHRTIIGLSSGYDWLLLVLSRHPHHLTRMDTVGISSAITQALRRMNGRAEQMHWVERDTRGIPDSSQTRTGPEDKGEDVARSKSISCDANAPRKGAPMERYHASVHTEEKSWSYEIVGAAQAHTACSDRKSPLTTSALIVHWPVPVLKVTSHDLRRYASCLSQADSTLQITALLVAALITLVQCRMALLENLQMLQRDMPIASIEPCDSKLFATPNMSPRQHDRMRSMSGSTVAEAVPHVELLSFSSISTVYSFSGSGKEVRWAEKRVSEEREAGTSPKRPKLTEYKQVSSGRVATLMDRFENFHL